MKKQHLFWFIAAASISIIFLIWIQVYWIQVSIQTHQTRFDQLVMESLNETISKLEKEEAITQFTSKLMSENKLGMSEKDSVVEVEQFPINEPFLNNSISKDKEISGQKGDQFVINFSPSNLLDSSIFIIRKTQKRVLNSDFLSSPSKDNLLKNKIEQKATLINDIVNELALISISRGSAERVDDIKLDSILQLQLNNNGITIPYHFDILDSETDQLSFTSNSGIASGLKSSPYKVSLFPNDYYESDYLMLYFPNQGRYIISSAWKVLLTSFLLVIILVSLFYFGIATIFKQKRLSLIKNDFINNMTHELKTPISTISLACEALEDHNLDLKKERRLSYVKMIHEENDRLGILVDSVLKSAVWDSVELKLNFKEHSVHKLINTIVSAFGIQVEKLGGKIKLNLNASNDLLFIDDVHFTNVIYNLLDNARKYSKTSPEIELTTQNSGDQFVLLIQDKGIGIKPQDQKKVFDKFYRVPTGNIHDVKGFGLGLSYVKRIVELHNGSIGIKSAVGKGTSIILKIQQNGR